MIPLSDEEMLQTGQETHCTNITLCNGLTMVCLLMKRCKPFANSACAVLLIDGLGQVYSGLHAIVACGESDTG